jgi:hypothetical protein
VGSAVATEIIHDPARLGLFITKRKRAHRKRGLVPAGLGRSVLEERLVHRDQTPREVDDTARRAPVVLEVDDAIGLDLEILPKRGEDSRISARPRIHGLLVVADGEDVAMVARQSAYDRVLNWIEILEFVDEDRVPSPSQRHRHGVDSKQLGGLENERVEVRDVSFGDDAPVLVVVFPILLTERDAAKAVTRKRLENRLLLVHGHFEAAEKRPLISLVGDTEADLQSNLLPKLAQQLGTKGVDRPTLDSLYAGAKLALEPFGDLTRCLVGKCEDADAPRIDRELLDEESDSLDEAKRFSRAGPGENEQRLCDRLYRGTLRS